MAPQSENPLAYDFHFLPSTEDHERVERTLIATLKEVQNHQTIQDFLLSNGVQRVKVIPMGALEFHERIDMNYFLARTDAVMWRKFEIFTQATLQSVPTRHLVWIRIKNVPLGSWNLRFFSGMVAS